jgi:hypothetical protein
LWYAGCTWLVSGKRVDGGKVGTAMTMALINVLLGLISILFGLSVAVVALAALAYAVEGIFHGRVLRRWSLVLAFLLGTYGWSVLTSVGQDFVRASDARLPGTPANAASLITVLVWTLISVSTVVADVAFFRSLLRSLATQA